MIELLYDGTVKFKFEDGDHLYTKQLLVDKAKDLWTPATPVLGVTTVKNIIDKPALIGWSAKLAAEYMRDNVKQPEQLKRMAEIAKRQHIEVSNKGKQAGTVGHELVEALLAKKPYAIKSDDTQSESVAAAFQAWRKDYQPGVVEQERACYSLAHDFAGKFDLLCEIDGKLTLVDFKTSNSSYKYPDGIYPDMYCQLGGYLVLIAEQLGVQVDDAIIVNLPKDGSEYKTKSLSEIGLSQGEAKLYFLSALALYKLNASFGWKV